MNHISDIVESLVILTLLDENSVIKLLEIPPDQKMGDLAFPCFQLAKTMKKSPVQIATELQSKIILNENSYFESCKANGPYLNFYYNYSKLSEYTLDQIWLKKEDYGVKEKNNKVILVESPSPNTNKPLHLGHLRNMALGLAVANILDTQGYTVKKINLYNDRGIHICKSMIAYEKWGNNEEPNKKSDHYVGDFYVMYEKKSQEDNTLKDQTEQMLIDWEQGKPEIISLWKKMNKWAFQGYEETFKRFGIEIDKHYYESEVYTKGREIILQGLKDGAFIKDESGAVIADLGKKLGSKVLLRSDGTAVYITQDIYLAKAKFDDFRYEKSLYVVASEQDRHFQVLFELLRKIGYDFADGCYHLSYGMVYLPEGKMKSREGKVVDADDIMDELTAMAKTELMKREQTNSKDLEAKAHKIGIAALKYYLLKFVPIKDFTYNPEESISFEGETGPYLQYAFVRIQKILEKLSFDLNEQIFNPKILINDSEKNLIKFLFEYPEILNKAALNYSPSIITQYIFKLCQNLNVFYENCRVIGAESKELEINRAYLLTCVSIVLKASLKLLGIDVVYSM
jgi:arginyl-tRNA synthetase